MRRALRILVVAVLIYPALVGVLSALDLVLPPVSTLMLARWATGRGVDRQAVPLTDVAPSLAAAVIASEDGRFCRHRGVDWAALGDVLDDADEGGPSRGASTVAMQTAKNLFLWPSRSYIRKALEIPIALWLDLVWGKRRVLQAYLNVAEWGEGVFGAEAAARRHFGKSARDLTPREAALLATSLPNPRLRDPAHPSRYQRRLVGIILARMPEAIVDCLRPG